jgi:LysM repeat protein
MNKKENKTMSEKYSPQNVLDSYRRRQRVLPYLIGGLAALLVIVGLIILIIYFVGPSSPFAAKPTATPTATATNTATPTIPTPTPTLTITETVTPTETQTSTPPGPVEYVVKEGETCWGIADKFKVDLAVLIALNPTIDCAKIQPGDKLMIPSENMVLPTATPPDLTQIAPGTYVEYTVQGGDTLATIASMWNTTVAQIRKDNPLITDPNKIEVGQKLRIKVNIVTPTPTLGATVTARTSPTSVVITVVKTSTKTP